MNQLLKISMLSVLFLSMSQGAVAHESTEVPGKVIVAGDNTGGKIAISEEAARKVFEALPKGCQKAHLTVRFGVGISCLKNSQQDSYNCTIPYNQEGVFTLFTRSTNCPDEL